ncbi:Meh1p Ecym_6128 [Eremothecium cymbalariae DBVPG|uniref:Uncharacterized protein n=1 Tax=Eremothecium cymbalariae (strain CBS 270.75 / DBVPG 7215 / KCTC 17166 / NRRL Y-17582) TaxID=931890 RepID=G8JV41_ERECY|nr:hypothetical protein Ecym_6128 [Eremothecium cymbalariae DBVPG\
MGIIFSCCSDDGDGEQDPLLDNQLGYGSQGSTNEDHHVLEQELQQKLLQRERELTVIVNNTNDKLIDISMMSNSGIVVQSHDLEDLESEDPSRSNFVTMDSIRIPKEVRSKVGQLHQDLFHGLETQLKVNTNGPLVVTL